MGSKSRVSGGGGGFASARGCRRDWGWDCVLSLGGVGVESARADE